MKKVCKLVKDGKLKKNKKFHEIVEKSSFYCTKCGRLANKEKALCDPEKLDNTD